MSCDLDVAVVGAGISGLGTAWALARRGVRVALLEKRHSAGGRIFSERHGGFLMEHGPNALISPAPATESLIRDLALGDERIDRGGGVRHRYLVRDGLAHALPLDPLEFFASGFFSLRARLRLLAEPFVAPQARDESVADFARRRLGRELLDYLVDPLVGGLQAGDPERLGVTATFPHLKRMERESGSIVRGLLRARMLRRKGRGSLDPRQRMLFSFRGGMAALPAALAAGLGERVQLGMQVEKLVPERGGWRLAVSRCGVAQSVRARAVVVALPAYAAAKLLQSIDAAVADAVRAIEHPPLAVVFLGYPAGAITHPLDGLGVLMPRIEHRGVLGMLFSSTLFAGRAPKGHVAITAYVGGAREPELAAASPAELVRRVDEEMRRLFGARRKPIHARVRYWRAGLPQPGVGHAERIGGLRALEHALPGIFVTGNYLNGVSTAACIDEAFAVAGRVSANLARHVATAAREAGDLAVLVA